MGFVAFWDAFLTLSDLFILVIPPSLAVFVSLLWFLTSIFIRRQLILMILPVFRHRVFRTLISASVFML